jgi:hypothetical protein
MARLDIAIGEEFPLEEKKSGDEGARGCRMRGHHHDHHHRSLRERWRHYFSRSRDRSEPNKTDKE